MPILENRKVCAIIQSYSIFGLGERELLLGLASPTGDFLAGDASATGERRGDGERERLGDGERRRGEGERLRGEAERLRGEGVRPRGEGERYLRGLPLLPPPPPPPPLVGLPRPGLL